MAPATKLSGSSATSPPLSCLPSSSNPSCIPVAPSFSMGLASIGTLSRDLLVPSSPSKHLLQAFPPSLFILAASPAGVPAASAATNPPYTTSASPPLNSLCTRDPIPPVETPFQLVSRRSRNVKNSGTSTAKATAHPPKRCFHCLATSHFVRDCKLAVIYKYCKAPGHILAFCPKKKASPSPS